ncbi:MAG: cysteine peptidase family C39 domain-containing protein [Oceanicaulis sp.]
MRPAKLVAALAAGLVVQACAAMSYIAPRYTEERAALSETTVLDRQDFENSCGLAALSTAFSAWGEPFDERAVYAETRPGSEAGYTLAELTEIVQARGGRLYSFRPDYADFVTHTGRRRPMILPVYKPTPRGMTALLSPIHRDMLVHAWWREDVTGEPNHYLVVLHADEDRVYLFDPAMGDFAVSREAFERQRALWSPVAALPVPGSALPSES